MSVYIFIGLMMNLSTENAQENQMTASHGSDHLVRMLPQVRVQPGLPVMHTCLSSLGSVKHLPTGQDLSMIPQNPHKNCVVGTVVFPVKASWIPGSSLAS